MSEINVPTQYVYVQELQMSALVLKFQWRADYLADVFLSLIAVEAAI